MTVRKLLNESGGVDVGNDQVLLGDGADVGTDVLDEEDDVVDVNGENDLDGENFDEGGGTDTDTEVDDISDAEIDSMLNESDDEGLEEKNQIDNLGDKKAAPFTAADAEEARAAKEAAKKEAECGDGEDKGDGKKDDGKKEGCGEKDKVDEEFDDPAEIIDPVLYTDADDPVVEEFGEIPDVVPDLPDEPIIDLGEDDLETEIDLETGVAVPSYEVEVPFVLPESRRIVVSRGDVVFFCGKAKKDLPSFAESTFAQAVKLLVKSKNLKGAFLNEGKKANVLPLSVAHASLKSPAIGECPEPKQFLRKGTSCRLFPGNRFRKKKSRLKTKFMAEAE
jgi:hypothetical protein